MERTNPYTYTPFDEPESGTSKGRRELQGVCGDDLLIGAIFLIFAVSIGLGLWLLFGRTERIEYRIKDHRPIEQQATGQQATEQAKQAISGTAAAETTMAQSEISPPIVMPDILVTKPASESGTAQSSQGTDAGSSQGGRMSGARSTGTDQSPDHGTTSIYAVDGGALRPAKSEARDSSHIAAEARLDPRAAAKFEPAFGALLPVKTLGAICTLRKSFVHLELIRDIDGDGWSLKKGTVLIGNMQGSQHDRAYITLVGFIDPDSGRIVKLAGDVLGADGAPGLNGKKRQISSK